MTSLLTQPRSEAQREAVTDGLDPGLDARHEQWLREQYLRDLDTVDREPAGCFFDSMGGLHRQAAEGVDA